MLGEVKPSAEEFRSPSSVPQTRERAAYSISSVRTPPLCDCRVRFHGDFLDNLAVVTPIPGTTGDILLLSLDMGVFRSSFQMSRGSGRLKMWSRISGSSVPAKCELWQQNRVDKLTLNARLGCGIQIFDCVLSLSELRGTSSMMDLADVAPAHVKPSVSREHLHPPK